MSKVLSGMKLTVKPLKNLEGGQILNSDRPSNCIDGSIEDGSAIFRSEQPSLNQSPEKCGGDERSRESLTDGINV